MLRKKVLAVVTSTALAVGVVGAPAAQAVGNQNGLVNVAVEDVIIQAPIGVAANVCGLTVAAVIAAAAAGPVDCDATVAQFPVAFQPQP